MTKLIKESGESRDFRYLVIQDNGICLYYSKGDHVCRACLNRLGTDAKSLLTEQSKLLYTYFTSLKVESGDGLPEYLCDYCSDKFTEFHEFWTTCKKSYNAMKEAFKCSTENKVTVYKHDEVNPFSENISVELFPLEGQPVCAANSDHDGGEKDEYEVGNIDNVNKYTDRDKPRQTRYNKNKTRKSLDTKTLKQSKRITVCPICDKEIIAKTFSGHMKIMHDMKTDKVRNCPVCKKEITSKNLSRHMQVMHEDLNSKKITYLNGNINKVSHIQEAFKEKVRKVPKLRPEDASTCPVCTRQIVGDFTKHLQKHDTVKFYCKICKKDFYSAYHSKKHDKNNYVLCQVCGKSIFNAHYAYHLKYHNKEKNHACANCGKKFYTPGLLRAHELDRHMGRQYICDYCNKVFVTKLAIRNHIYRHQTPRFKCNICEKAYRSHWMLYMHKRDHAGIKPYKCDFCQRGFQTKGRMKKHRVMHTGERNYNCRHCNQPFAYSTSCRRHEARCKLGKEKLNADTAWNIPMPIML